jgi:hypothetical protein
MYTVPASVSCTQADEMQVGFPIMLSPILAEITTEPSCLNQF